MLQRVIITSRNGVLSLLLVMLAACSGVFVKEPLDGDNVLITDVNASIDRSLATNQIEPSVITEYQQAIDMLEQGHLREADLLLSNVVEKHPDLSAPLYNLGVISEELGDHEKAVRFYKRALEADSNYYLALNNLGVIARSDGKFQDALDYYLKGLQVAPDSSELHYNLGVLHEIYLHDYEKAVEYYERYLSLAGSEATIGAEKNVIQSWINDLKRRSQ